MLTVRVVVRETSVPGGRNEVSVSVDPEPVVLAGDDDVEWDLDNSQAPGWLFVGTTGVWIKAPQNLFHNNGGTNGRKHGWKRRQADRKTYRYAINLEKKDGSGTTIATLSWDPSIVNN